MGAGRRHAARALVSLGDGDIESSVTLPDVASISFHRPLTRVCTTGSRLRGDYESNANVVSLQFSYEF